MKSDIKKHRQTFKELFDKVSATDANGIPLPLEEALENALNIMLERTKAGGKVFFIGNGGSASIASHMAVDLWKNANIRAHSFNDNSLLTCVSNDFGYKHVFKKPIEMFAEPLDILVGISSSGKSENILWGVDAAKKKGVKIITLSGFDAGNPLCKMGDVNFYVPSSEYGAVEVMHLALCHCLIDVLIKHKSQLEKKDEPV